MALRVLLADESPTIKKVMQISLQDFEIELKTVQLGIDVIQVAEQFRPDIIFCDVLLQKKSGYDVSREIKDNPLTANIPVVLMWSGFMELDEQKYRECRADGHIEKPFDSNALRDLVKKLVNSTNDQGMAEFLEFPEVTSLTQQKRMSNSPKKTPPPPQQEPNDASWTMDSFEDISHFNNQDSDLDSFTQKPLQPIKSHEVQPTEMPKPIATKIAPLGPQFAKNAQEETTSRGPQGLTLLPNTVKSSIAPETQSAIELPPEEEISHSELLSNVSMDAKDLDKFNIKPPKKIERAEISNEPGTATVALDLPNVRLTQEQLEFIIRAQSKEIIEKIVWKLVPDLADKLIKDEIHRLMDETKL